MRRRCTRRDFLRGTSYGGIAAAIGLSCAQRGTAEEPKARVVLVRRPEALDDSGECRAEVVRGMLDEAVAALSGSEAPVFWSETFRPDDQVAIKANVMMSVTRPQVLAAIADSLVEHARVGDEAVLAWDRTSGGIGRGAASAGQGAWQGGRSSGTTSRPSPESPRIGRRHWSTCLR